MSSLIKDRIEQSILGSEVIFTGTACQLQAIVISDRFDGLTRISRQKLVYEVIGDLFASGEVHALSFKTLTRAEAIELKK